MDQEANHRKLDDLKAEHRRLDREIAEMVARRPFDQIAVQRLKKRKLLVKDEIVKLESAIVPDIIA